MPPTPHPLDPADVEHWLTILDVPRSALDGTKARLATRIGHPVTDGDALWLFFEEAIQRHSRAPMQDTVELQTLRNEFARFQAIEEGRGNRN